MSQFYMYMQVWKSISTEGNLVLTRKCQAHTDANTNANMMWTKNHISLHLQGINLGSGQLLVIYWIEERATKYSCKWNVM